MNGIGLSGSAACGFFSPVFVAVTYFFLLHFCDHELVPPHREGAPFHPLRDRT